LKGNGQALEQKYCLSAVLGDKCDLSANLLNQFNSHLVPCPGSFNGNWEEEVSTRKITILGGLIGSRFIALLLLYLRGGGSEVRLATAPGTAG